MATSTPWGKSDHSKKYARGIVFYGTPGHGGFHVSAKLNEKIHPAFRKGHDASRGWYEEDCAWAIVAMHFPEAFKSEEAASARKVVKNYWPDEYELATGEKVAVAESYVLRERAFAEAHKDDWVVTSASYVPGDASRCLVYALKGGRRGEGVPARSFYVLTEEYNKRTEFGFIVDPSRHPEVQG